MKSIIRWHKTHQARIRLVRTSLGGVTLLVSLILGWTNQSQALPFDLAWFAIVLCAVPIAIGALIGLIRDHDVTADVLVSLALVGCLILKVLPGEEVPIDGRVLSGASTLDESALTGESLPVEKKIGDKVYSGTMNLTSALFFKATSRSENSSFQRIVALAKEQDSKKAKVVRKANRWAAWMVLVSFLTALITCLSYYAATQDFWFGFQRGVTVLVVFCPCAFVLQKAEIIETFQAVFRSAPSDSPLTAWQYQKDVGLLQGWPGLFPSSPILPDGRRKDGSAEVYKLSCPE
jgi:cation transport ATPase